MPADLGLDRGADVAELELVRGFVHAVAPAVARHARGTAERDSGFERAEEKPSPKADRVAASDDVIVFVQGFRQHLASRSSQIRVSARLLPNADSPCSTKPRSTDGSRGWSARIRRVDRCGFGRGVAAGLPSFSTVFLVVGMRVWWSGGYWCDREGMPEALPGVGPGPVGGQVQHGVRCGRAQRAGTAMILRRRVDPRALARAAPASTPAACSRLWVIAAHNTHAEFTPNLWGRVQ